MGFGTRQEMRQGLEAVKSLSFPRIGTITIDSYTRQGMIARASYHAKKQAELNGYPIASFTAAENDFVTELSDGDFPIQVRHGSAKPAAIFRAAIDARIDATEGGPVSYCLPYGRTPLAESIEAWREACALWSSSEGWGEAGHLETFAGCMMGQLCPPDLLVALAVLEGLFFVHNGVRSISLSYSQGTNLSQDIAAIRALRAVSREYFAGVDWHVVLYTFMGLFPKTRHGARQLIEESAFTAKVAGAERLIVKTEAEAHRIPTISENLEAMGLASRAAELAEAQPPDSEVGAIEYAIEHDARLIIESVMELASEPGAALLRAFALGRLDVPYCLHPNNLQRVRTAIDERGLCYWTSTGRLALRGPTSPKRYDRALSEQFLEALAHHRSRLDQPMTGSKIGYAAH
jgi:methylaspartate mutase epsilon subunit